jgi:WD40 repeat protein
MRVLEFNETDNTIQTVAAFPTDGRLLNVTACHTNSTSLLVETCGSGSSTSKSNVSVSVLSDLDSDIRKLSVSSLLERPGGIINSLLWESTDRAVLSHSGGINMYNTSKEEAISSVELNDCGNAVVDLHNPFTILAAAGKSLCRWDMRTREIGYTFKTSNMFQITALDVNPNSDNIVATGSADGKISIWDIRGTMNEALKSFDSHNHAVTVVKYNPIHDELILTAGTDCSVNLWRVVSVSSNPSRHKQLIERPDFARARRKSNEDVKQVVQDGLVQKYNRHEDSVYRACWGSGNSAWAFASASYDGLAMFNSVPSAEKQRIML